MGKNAPFGRPGASDRLRLWWHGTNKTSRMNGLLFLVVGVISAALVWAGVSRDSDRTRGVAATSRFPVSVPSSLPTVPVPPDLRAAGAEPVPDQIADTTSTTATTTGTVAPPTTVPAASTPRTAPPSPSTSAAPSPATTVPTNDVVFAPVPAPPPATDPTVPPLPSSSVPTTRPPTTAPPPTSPPTSAPPTTSGTLLPLPVPLLGGG